MRLVVTRCSVEYQGRLGARLAPAVRLLLFKADGSVAVHSDAKAYKPLNWMNPPCTIAEADGVITVSTPKGERLVIELHEVLSDQTFELGEDPGLDKDGVEADLQRLLAPRLHLSGQVTHRLGVLLDSSDEHALRGRSGRGQPQVGIGWNDGGVRPELTPVERAFEVSGHEIQLRGRLGRLRGRQLCLHEARRQEPIPLLVGGLIISIPLIVAGATLIMALLTRFPVLVWAGAALLGWIAGELIVSDKVALVALQDWNAELLAPDPDSALGIKAGPLLHHAAATIGAVLVLAWGWLLLRRRSRGAVGVPGREGGPAE